MKSAPARSKKPESKKTPSKSPSTSGTAAVASSRSTKPAQAPQLPNARVYADHQRRTCIQFERTDQQVTYVAINTEEGFDLSLDSPKNFDARFKPLAEYPVDRAAQLYLEYARGIGASERVMRLLAKLTNVTNEDIEMATKKKAAREAGVVKTTKKTPAKKAAEAVKAVKTKASPGAAKPKPATKEGVEKAAKAPSAAMRFQELIMEGKLTDEQIFAKVQKEFNLDDKKKSYVKWYRNHLQKQGKNPPAAKE